MTNKRLYFNICLDLAKTDPKWLEASANNPSRHMTKIHVLLARLALRKVNLK